MPAENPLDRPVRIGRLMKWRSRSASSVAPSIVMPRHQHGELVTTDAVEPILRSRDLAHGAAHRGQQLVPPGMAVVVVDDLEVVEVHEHETERLA